MARRAFYSFHYEKDNWRASMVRNMGAIEGNKPANDNDWETVKRGGEKAIQKWIDEQMKGKSCVVVLVGEKTASRKWIKYEIKKAWQDGKGVVGIQIHKLKDASGNTSSAGKNPFEAFSINNKSMSSIVKLKKPTQTTSSGVYNHIKNNIADWIEEAISIRKNYK